MNWQRNTYWLESLDGQVATLTTPVFERVLRTNWFEPGFAVIALPSTTTSHQLREQMVSLKTELSRLFAAKWGETLDYLSLGRFDQQTSTKLHLDGGPDRSVLMLGYEPSEVASEMIIADYSACAAQMGITPAAFLTDHNPMFQSGENFLTEYTTSIKNWDENRCRIVVINNSSVSSDHLKFTGGVLHGARILNPDTSKTRVINSTMIAPSTYAPETTTESVREFVTTDIISGPIVIR